MKSTSHNRNNQEISIFILLSLTLKTPVHQTILSDWTEKPRVGEDICTNPDIQNTQRTSIHQSARGTAQQENGQKRKQENGLKAGTGTS